MIFDLNYTYKDIAKAVNGKLVGADGLITGVTINSREKSSVEHCFFAIKGKKHNGINYVREAVSNGAKLIVAQEKTESSVPVIYVENTTKALGLLGKKHKGKTKIIGITGSNGKTTTKDMAISVLKAKYPVTGTLFNNNNEIGVALTLLSIKKEDFCVVEMGMRGLGEIEWLSYISEPETSIITNCGSSHIGLLGSKENIFKAKTEILTFTKKYAILPDEKKFKALTCENLNKIYIGENGNYAPQNLRCNNSHLIFDVGECKDIKINSIYEHDAINAAFAYALGKLYGIDDLLIKERLESFSKEKSRGEIISVKGIEIINDCYNASYESARSAIISTVRQYSKTGKRIAVLLGDMLELGIKSARLHYDIGKLCREEKVQKMYTYGEYSKFYLQGFGSGEELSCYETIAEQILEELNEEYVLLVKASNAMNFQNIIEKMREIGNEHR